MSKFKKAAFAAGTASLLITGLVLAQTTFAQGPINGLAKMRKFSPPVAMGTVALVSGNTITLTGKDGVTYTVDATSAVVQKFAPVVADVKPAPSTITVAQIQTGDALTVFGTASGSTIKATKIIDGQLGSMMGGKNGMGRGVTGTVSAVSSNTITVAGKNGTTYYVDATNAKIIKPGSGTNTTISISGIVVGDTVMVKGTITGSNVVATQVIDGNGKHVGNVRGHKFTKPTSESK